MVENPDIEDTDDREAFIETCRWLFERLESVAGDDFARRLFKDAFWIGYDGKKPPVIFGRSAAELALYIHGAQMLLDALIETGTLKSR